MTSLPALVPCLTAPLAEAKELLEACHAADIPAELARDAGCCGPKGSGGGGCGCAPKIQLLVPPEDVPRVAHLLEARWQALVEREAVEPEALDAAAAAGEHAPCPACGTAAPLVEGACSDCGLQLE